MSPPTIVCYSSRYVSGNRAISKPRPPCGRGPNNALTTSHRAPTGTAGRVGCVLHQGQESRRSPTANAAREHTITLPCPEQIASLNAADQSCTSITPLSCDRHTCGKLYVRILSERSPDPTADALTAASFLAISSRLTSNTLFVGFNIFDQGCLIVCFVTFFLVVEKNRKSERTKGAGGQSVKSATSTSDFDSIGHPAGLRCDCGPPCRVWISEVRSTKQWRTAVACFL